MKKFNLVHFILILFIGALVSCCDPKDEDGQCGEKGSIFDVFLNDGEDVEADLVYDIIWSHENVEGDVKIERCDVSGDCEMIDPSVPAVDQSYSWWVFADQVASSGNVIRITSNEDADVFGDSGKFAILSDYVVDDHGGDILTATVVDADSTTDGYLGEDDEDFLGTYVSPGDILSLVFSPENADICLTVFDSSGDVVVEEVCGTEEYLLAEGTYYFRMKGQNSYVTGDWSLILFSEESGDHGDYAASVYSSGNVSGSIEFAWDRDCFKRYYEAGVTYNFDTIGDTDTRGFLYDPLGNPLASVFGGGEGGNFSFSYEITESGEYTDCVSGDTVDVTGDYIRRVSVVE